MDAARGAGLVTLVSPVAPVFEGPELRGYKRSDPGPLCYVRMMQRVCCDVSPQDPYETHQATAKIAKPGLTWLRDGEPKQVIGCAWPPGYSALAAFFACKSA